jgi:hypothetical protein
MYIFGFANGRNENVCILDLDLVSGLVLFRTTAYNLHKVLSLAVTLSNGGIPAAQYRRNGTADNVTSTKYNSICSRKRNARRLQQAQDAGRRTRCEQRQCGARR